MTKRRRSKAITKQEFREIKNTLESGVPGSKVARIFNRSNSSIHTIKRSETFEGYKKFTADRWRTTNKSNQNQRAVSRTQSESGSETISNKLDRIEKLLIEIAKKL